MYQGEVGTTEWRVRGGCLPSHLAAEPTLPVKGWGRGLGWEEGVCRGLGWWRAKGLSRPLCEEGVWGEGGAG